MTHKYLARCSQCNRLRFRLIRCLDHEQDDKPIAVCLECKLRAEIGKSYEDLYGDLEDRLIQYADMAEEYYLQHNLDAPCHCIHCQEYRFMVPEEADGKDQA